MTSYARIDGLQYCDWNRERFLELRGGGLNAVHATVCYYENFRETAANIAGWNEMFSLHSDLIMPGRDADDVRIARESGRAAIFFGFQNCSPLEDDVGLVEICHALGARFMQPTYNNQTSLAGGCYEERDGGVTRAGREVIAEMNRLGMVIDMSHSGEESTLQAIQLSRRPIAITHANPAFWHACPRNKSEAVLRALGDSGGMLGLSLYPHHLKSGGECTLQSFCEMAARAAEIIGVRNLGIGSDLCRGHPDSVVRWMRNGRWRRNTEDESAAVFPPQPEWFESAADFDNLHSGLRAAGFGEKETGGILGENWLRFFAHSFRPE
ncbi:MAG: membrane dipeptidase [Gammaproteobacteria bacterium]